MTALLRPGAPYDAPAPSTRPRPSQRLLAVLAGLSLAIGPAAGRLLAAWSRARTGVLTVAGFMFLTAAAWVIALPFGLAAAGVSCFLIEYLTSPDGGPTP